MAKHVDLEKRIPYSKFQYVTVTFNATANVDTDIPHSLSPSNPEAVQFEVVKWELGTAPATPPIVYKDSSASRTAWQSTHIYLRCTLASAVARIRLFIE